MSQINGKLKIIEQEYPEVYEHLSRFNKQNRMGEVRALLDLAVRVKNSGAISIGATPAVSYAANEVVGISAEEGVTQSMVDEVLAADGMHSGGEIPIDIEIDEDLLDEDFDMG